MLKPTIILAIIIAAATILKEALEENEDKF
jgi:hypothetical protein